MKNDGIRTMIYGDQLSGEQNGDEEANGIEAKECVKRIRARNQRKNQRRKRFFVVKLQRGKKVQRQRAAGKVRG